MHNLRLKNSNYQWLEVSGSIIFYQPTPHLLKTEQIRILMNTVHDRLNWRYNFNQSWPHAHIKSIKPGETKPHSDELIMLFWDQWLVSTLSYFCPTFNVYVVYSYEKDPVNPTGLSSQFVLILFYSGESTVNHLYINLLLQK